jgi:acyl-CoA thioesterase I
VRSSIKKSLAVGVCFLAVTTAVIAATPQIVILGDSLTAGYGIQPTQAFPALLQEKITEAGLQWEVVNAGRSGDTTADGLRRVSGVITPATKVLIVALGANDGLRQISPARMSSNLAAIIAKARTISPSIKVILAGMQMPADWVGNVYSAEYRAAFQKVAESQKTAFLPYLLDRVGGVVALNQPDRLHPTAEGQKIIADTVWRVLRPALE